MSVPAATARLLIAALIVGTGLASASTVISNGDFATGDASNWTPFTTANGTAGFGAPVVVPFAVDGVNTVNAVRLQVGQATHTNFLDQQGGGISQIVNLDPGMFTVSAQIAAQNPGAPNLSAGTAQILLNDAVVSSYSFGAIDAGQVLRSTISYTAAVSGGSYRLGFQFTRPALADGTTPYQYFGNIFGYQNYYGAYADFVEVPEPSSFVLLLAGSAAVIAVRRRGRARPAR